MIKKGIKIDLASIDDLRNMVNANAISKSKEVEALRNFYLQKSNEAKRLIKIVEPLFEAAKTLGDEKTMSSIVSLKNTISSQISDGDKVASILNSAVTKA
jgi:hypothetical protein